jgi:hypothetical protein
MFQGEDMKKITVLILALGLSMPAHSWTLFSVKEKIVEVPKTNYTACAITGVVVGVITLIVGVFGGAFLDILYNETSYSNAIENTLVRVNCALAGFSLTIDDEYNIKGVSTDYGTGTPRTFEVDRHYISHEILRQGAYTWLN